MIYTAEILIGGSFDTLPGPHMWTRGRGLDLRIFLNKIVNNCFRFCERLGFGVMARRLTADECLERVFANSDSENEPTGGPWSDQSDDEGQDESQRNFDDEIDVPEFSRLANVTEDDVLDVADAAQPQDNPDAVDADEEDAAEDYVDSHSPYVQFQNFGNFDQKWSGTQCILPRIQRVKYCD